MARRGKKRPLGLEDEYWKLIADGVGTVAACKQLGIGRKTGYRWRAETGGLPPQRDSEQMYSSRFLSLLDRQRMAALRSRGLGGAPERFPARRTTDDARTAWLTCGFLTGLIRRMSDLRNRSGCPPSEPCIGGAGLALHQHVLRRVAVPACNGLCAVRASRDRPRGVLRPFLGCGWRRGRCSRGGGYWVGRGCRRSLGGSGTVAALGVGASVGVGVGVGVSDGVGVGVSDGVGDGVGVGVSVAEGVAVGVALEVLADDTTARVGCGFGGSLVPAIARPAVPITRLPMRRAATPPSVVVPNQRVRRRRINARTPVTNATKLMNQRADPSPLLTAPRRPSSRRIESPTQKDGPGRSTNIRRAQQLYGDR